MLLLNYHYRIISCFCFSYFPDSFIAKTIATAATVGIAVKPFPANATAHLLLLIISEIQKSKQRLFSWKYLLTMRRTHV